MYALYLLIAVLLTVIVGAAGYAGYATYLHRGDAPGRHRADDVIWTRVDDNR